MIKIIADLKRNAPLIRLMEEAYINHFALTFEDSAPLVDGLNDANKMDWLGPNNDVGTNHLMDCTLKDLFDLGGLPYDEKHPMFPFFNDWIAPSPKTLADFPNFKPGVTTDEEALAMGLRRFNTMWHQACGTLAMMGMGYRSDNIILADSVGVGKTVECLMLIAALRTHRLLQENHDPSKGTFRFPKVGECSVV